MSPTLLFQLSLLCPVQVDAQPAREKVSLVVATREQIGFYKRVADILGTVRDKDSSGAAVRRLKALREDALAQWSNSQNLADSGEDIGKKLRTDGEAANRAFNDELYRIKSIPGWPGVRQEVQGLWLAMYRGCESDQVLTWKWSDENASLPKCVEQHLAGFSVEFADKREFYTPFKIVENSDGRVVYSRDKRPYVHVLTRWKDTMFITNHSAIATGCEVVAVNLKTGKELWKTRLFGTGPTPEWHSKYGNQVNIDTDGKRVIIYGNEDDGRYVEHLDINTGKTLANQRFEHEWLAQRAGVNGK